MAFFTLITGATGGLGHAFAFSCAKKGQNLVLTGTKVEKLEDLLITLKEKYPNQEFYAKACDLSDADSRKEFISCLDSLNIEIDRLINNAGYIIEGEFLKHSDEEIIKTIRVNCEGTIDITQKIIKRRNQSKDLHIITISSMAGDYPMPYMGIYASTKSMLTNIMVALNYELRNQNIFITTVCPSGIPTSKEMKEAIKAQGLAGKITASSPEYIAKLALSASEKHKVLVVPKCINKFIKGISRVCSEKTLAKVVGKRWQKSQKNRNF